MSKKIKYLVAPNPLDKNLTKEINGFDENFKKIKTKVIIEKDLCLLYTSPSPRDKRQSRMPSSA